MLDNLRTVHTCPTLNGWLGGPTVVTYAGNTGAGIAGPMSRAGVDFGAIDLAFNAEVGEPARARVGAALAVATARARAPSVGDSVAA